MHGSPASRDHEDEHHDDEHDQDRFDAHSSPPNFNSAACLRRSRFAAALAGY
jgi:hypothetical protein